MYEDKSLDQLWREFLVRVLSAGAGYGSDVNITNAFLTSHVDNFPADQLIHGLVSVANFPASFAVSNFPGDTRGLTERMLSKAPQTGYALWLDTADATYIYVAEAPVAADGSVNTFNGIRITKDANGNPLGKVSYKTGFIWDNRASVSWP